MSAWPQSMKVGPIGDWPGTMTSASQRRQAPFRAMLTKTLTLLDRELYELAETRAHQESAELLVAIPAGAFRLDGRPRADARAEHPGVILSMDTKHGHLSYPCDTFTTWEDNLRAVALALEALRKVDRYGVTRRGEQYRGFVAIEATPGSGFSGPEDALVWILDLTDTHGETVDPRAAVRAAKRIAHPDQGGNAETFHRVMLAEAAMRQGGIL